MKLYFVFLLLFLLNATNAQSIYCADQAVNCAESSNLCFNSAYSSLMRRLCAITCGYCQDEVVQPFTPFYNSPYNYPYISPYTYPYNSGSSGCSDSSINCPSWVKNGFCTNPFYTDSIRRSYCAASCGLCSYYVGK